VERGALMRQQQRGVGNERRLTVVCESNPGHSILVTWIDRFIPWTISLSMKGKRDYTSQTLYNFLWDELKGRNSPNIRRHSPADDYPIHHASAPRRSGPTRTSFARLLPAHREPGPASTFSAAPFRPR
jgi:hypothetical protein